MVSCCTTRQAFGGFLEDQKLIVYPGLASLSRTRPAFQLVLLMLLSRERDHFSARRSRSET